VSDATPPASPASAEAAEAAEPVEAAEQKPNVIVGEDGRARCRWAASDPEYLRYHDEEWGTPLHGDRHLYEKLSLEGFQAGLSWITILRRRPAFREVFHDFDPQRVASMDESEIEAAMADARIIRNRAKVLSTIKNARLTLDLVRDHPGALDELLWSFAPPTRGERFGSLSQIPAVTAESTAMSKALRALGFGFVGPTTMYALMQSAGMVDDHVEGCWRSS
jgi:DNA-3-methyladenine glycosylase I